MHGVAHVLDAVLPTVRVASNGSHTRLKPMANKASLEKYVLPCRRGKQLLRLVNRKFVPANSGLLQCEIKRSVLVRREIFNAIPALAIRKHDECHSHLRVLRLDERPLKRRAIRVLHGPRDGRGVTSRTDENNRANER